MQHEFNDPKRERERETKGDKESGGNARRERGI